MRLIKYTTLNGHTPAAGALPLVWKGLVAISGATAAATKGFVDGTAK